MIVVRWVLIASLAAVVSGVVAIVLAQRGWRATTEAMEAEVASGAEGTNRLAPDSLPAPVARYLARSLPESDRGIRYARLRQEGTFQMGEGEEGWRAFTADEVFRTHPPALLWDARITVAPGVAAFVRDSYRAESARMLGKVAALITVVDEESTPALASGALARYLAEAVWFPTRLAVGPGLTWSPLDEDRAVATLSEGGHTVSLTFVFDDAGDPVRVEGIRERATDAGFVPTPWIGTFSAHGDAGGYRIPLYGEVGWVIDGQLVPYWRGHIRSAEFR